jgi:hypothetical protein
MRRMENAFDISSRFDVGCFAKGDSMSIVDEVAGDLVGNYVPKNVPPDRCENAFGGIDLLEYAQKHRLTFVELAARLQIPQDRQVGAYARGESWPHALRLQDIVERTDGEVSVYKMHLRRLKWLRENAVSRPSKRVDIETKDL